MSKQPLDLLYHIRDELEFLVSESGELTEELFEKDEKSKRAFVRSLEIVGEAAKNFPESYKLKHSDIPWKSMARMRDKLIHHYFGVDYPVVWDTVVSDAPNLLLKIKMLIEAEPVAGGDAAR